MPTGIRCAARPLRTWDPVRCPHSVETRATAPISPGRTGFASRSLTATWEPPAKPRLQMIWKSAGKRLNRIASTGLKGCPRCSTPGASTNSPGTAGHVARRLLAAPRSSSALLLAAPLAQLRLASAVRMPGRAPSLPHDSPPIGCRRSGHEHQKRPGSLPAPCA